MAKRRKAVAKKTSTVKGTKLSPVMQLGVVVVFVAAVVLVAYAVKTFLP